ncbi:MAG TPA: DNA polymerase III subunit delta [Xanthobacteraceae bacterium]
MVALNRAAVDAYLAEPNAAQPVALVFGPDAGLVSERVQAILRATVEDLNDPFRLVRLEGDELAADPARLLDEAGTIPLFGGKRAIWVKAGGRDFVRAVEALITTPIADCRIVIEAADLRRGVALRTLCERARNVAAIPCYADGERELARLIDDEMRAAGLTIAPEARAVVVSLLGSDRRASLSEIRKLALYARGRPRVELDDVLAVVADAAALALDGVIDAAFAGKPVEVEKEFARARSSGIAPGRIVTAALNQLSQLHRARLAVESGTPIVEAVDRITPKAQFRRVPAVEAALRNWTAARLEQVMSQLAEAGLQTRQLTGSAAALSDPLVSRALLGIAQAARRKI